ncbi:MAG: 23S rRNA (adenine(2503)-C(2))-methyltransferase RlmN [Gammaproteobacteria bacterium]
MESYNAQAVSFFDQDPAMLEALLPAWGERSFRATQLLKWVYQRNIIDLDAMTDLGKALREKLKHSFSWELPLIVRENLSSDGTIKWLLQVAGGNFIETVYIPEAKRGTLCISSQVGCMLNCSFCSTATQGFNRNLKTSEIIGQVWLATQRLIALNRTPGITNVVLMGMGEPMLNLDQVVPALRLMLNDRALGLSKRKVTLSTSGVVPNIALLQSQVDVALAVSLHAPNDPLRNTLVPINKKYPLKELIAACKAYIGPEKKRSITMEYVMLKDVNDTQAIAKELIRLLEGVHCKINLIPFNPFPGAKYECSDYNTILNFQKKLNTAGFVTTIRKTRGQDIDAACGQLVGKIIDKTSRQERHDSKNDASHSSPTNLSNRIPIVVNAVL